MVDREKVVAALVGALNDPHRPTALYPLARIKYPMREIQPVCQDSTIMLTLKKYGYEYKHRGPRPKTAPVIQADKIRQILNNALSPVFIVESIEDTETSVILTVRKRQ